jgi:hypothetical protein
LYIPNDPINARTFLSQSHRATFKEAHDSVVCEFLGVGNKPNRLALLERASALVVPARYLSCKTL